MSKFIVTYTPYFKKNMIRELIKIDDKIKIEKIITEGILLLNSNLDFYDFIDKILQLSPIFVKHLMPVMITGKVKGNTEIDKKEIFSKVRDVVKLKKGSLFAVQCRIISGGSNGLDYSSKDIEVYIGQYYEKEGNIPTFSDNLLKNEDIMVISVLINKDDYYLGFSSSKQNLNFHCDEYRICSKKEKEISRAENKLKEALIKFNISLSGEGDALDIGAAPGGWTKVLADYGYNVYAVDPGDLNQELQNNPKVKHYKCRIENLKFDNFFDIIVNDMNVDPEITGEIMNQLSGTLKNGGLAIVTLKLPNRIEERISNAVAILNKCYEVINIKSLFHNRQEVTALLKKEQIHEQIIEQIVKNH